MGVSTRSGRTPRKKPRATNITRVREEAEQQDLSETCDAEIKPIGLDSQQSEEHENSEQDTDHDFASEGQSKPVGNMLDTAAGSDDDKEAEIQETGSSDGEDVMAKRNIGNAQTEEVHAAEETDQIALSTDEDEPDETGSQTIDPKEASQNVASLKASTRSLLTKQVSLDEPKRPKSGIVYLSRLPPRIEITALRQLLSATGSVGRIWFRPHASSQNFRDGWVEYKRRKDAKKTVELLNATPMRGKRRKGRWSEDLWSMKYLKGFQWSDLSREVFGVQREKDLRVREEVMVGRREKGWVEERAGLKRKLDKVGVEDRKSVRRFRQKDVLEDEEEARARMVANRAGSKQADSELVGMLFRRNNKS